MDIKSIRENVYDIYRYSKYGDDRAMNSMIKFYEQGTESPQQSMLIMMTRLFFQKFRKQTELSKIIKFQSI